MTAGEARIKANDYRKELKGVRKILNGVCYECIDIGFEKIENSDEHYIFSVLAPVGIDLQKIRFTIEAFLVAQRCG